jgi:hypothetical protein
MSLVMLAANTRETESTPFKRESSKKVMTLVSD